jgi:hypothetical protein
MYQTELSPKAVSILSSKGWNGAPHNIDRDLADLREEGFSPPPSYAASILEIYSGIEFEVIDAKFLNRSLVLFGLEKALEIPCVRKNLIEHEIILGKQLYPIGSIDLFHKGHDNSYERTILLVAEDNSVYSSVSYALAKEGHDINDAINRIVNGESLWKYSDEYKVSYSYRDSRLKELRKKEAACSKTT